MDKVTANSESELTPQPSWKKYLSNNYLRITFGVIVGAGLGFLYWKYIGCTSGSCPLTSDPYKSMGWFGLIGGLFFHKGKNQK